MTTERVPQSMRETSHRLIKHRLRAPETPSKPSLSSFCRSLPSTTFFLPPTVHVSIHTSLPETSSPPALRHSSEITNLASLLEALMPIDARAPPTTAYILFSS